MAYSTADECGHPFSPCLSERRHHRRLGAALVRPLILLSLGLAFSLASPRIALGVFGAIDVVPAATLLLPYFEVDLAAEDDDAATTRFWVRNTSGAATIAHGVVWTDLGVATQTFNIPLAPYATAEVDLRDLFFKGTLRFAAFGSDCDKLAEELDPELVNDLQSVHIGRESSVYFAGQCGAANHDDRTARGFITFDAVASCTELTPEDFEYFESKGGIITADNVLWGEFELSDRDRGRAQSEPMVHIEAQEDFGIGTFYYHVYGSSGADHREPLPRRAGARYFHQLTDLVCWRDVFLLDPFPCGTAPAQTQGGAVFPSLRQVAVRAYDHQSNVDVVDDAAIPCQLTAARTTVGGNLFPVAAKTGWLSVDAEPTFDAALSGFTPAPLQIHLVPVHSIHPQGLSLSTGGVALEQSPFAPSAAEAAAGGTP